MKSNFLLIGTLFLFLTLGFTSCSDDDDGGPAGNAASGTIVGTVDGTVVQSESMLSFANKVTSGPANAFTIQGTNNQGTGFQFTINAYDGVGTYTFGDPNVVQAVSVIANYIENDISDINNPVTSTWTAPFDDNSVRGEINFSSDDGTNIQGTFEFEAKNPNDNTIVNVTSGSFNLDYTTF